MSYIRMDVWKRTQTQGFHLDSTSESTPQNPPNSSASSSSSRIRRSAPVNGNHSLVCWLMERWRWGDWVKPWVSHSCGTWWFAGVPWKTQGLCNHYPIVCQHLGWGSLEWIFVRVRSSFWLLRLSKQKLLPFSHETKQHTHNPGSGKCTTCL